MMTPTDLQNTLLAVTPPEYVRFAAHWLTEADVDRLDEAPEHLTGDKVIDALVAATVGHKGLATFGVEPAWTAGHHVGKFHYLGQVPSLFAWSFAHTPASYKVRGLIVERDSLESV